jgi:predicted RNA binding protein YcfA (HicA-like mRNA interferase family)
MTRFAKLYRKLIDGRPLSFAEVEKLLRAFGYVRIEQRGSHVSWRHPDTGDKRVIQPK